MPHKTPKGSIAVAYAIHKRSKKMAGGGDVGRHSMKTYAGQASQKGVHAPRNIGGPSKEKHGQSSMGYAHEAKDPETVKRQHAKVRAESASIHPKLKGLAHGGMYAEGGQIEDNYQSSCNSMCNTPCEIHPEESGFVDHEGNDVKHNGSAMSESARGLGQHGEDEQGPYNKMMADGGYLDDEDRYLAAETAETDAPMESKEKYPANHGKQKEAVKGIIERAQGYRKQHPEEFDEERKMARGGFITDNYQPDNPGEDMVSRIMKQRQNHYSEGGKVANDAHEFEYEFETPNQFDDLALRDDLSSDYDGDNAGDHLGNAGEDKRRKDIVSKIMRSRKLKDRNPNPA